MGMTANVPRLQQAIEQVLNEEAGSDVAIECQWCGMTSDDVGSDRVVEHALFDHATRSGLTIVRRDELFSSYELALAAGVPALTGHEEQWREEKRNQGCATPATE